MTTSRRDGMTNHPINKAIHLKNVTCPYCGKPFSHEMPSTKEHVVGRNFVPRGTLNGQPNLLLLACGPCNGRKSDLENDLSVISMHPDAHGRFAVDDQRLRDEVQRKAGKAISRRTRKPVADGDPPIVIRGTMGPTVQMSFTMQGPPQADDRRIFELAHSQLLGFFYWLTYRTGERRGSPWVGGYFPLMAIRRADWGNPQLLWFERHTKNWSGRLAFVIADGFYKVWIRRENNDSPVWAWAIEWNHNFRVAGFFGELDTVKPHIEAMPALQMDSLHESPNRFVRFHLDTPLSDSENTLFTWDLEEAIPAEQKAGDTCAAAQP